jgi:SAM-dependent methyltransferase
MGDPHQPRDVYDPARYGEDHAGVYDRIYPSFPTADAVRRIADLAFDRTGPVLDLGIGTGRLALPLTAAGVDVHGIEASPAMITRLRARPGGTAVRVWPADMAEWTIPERYSVIVCAVSTLFMLPERRLQASCLRAARRHLQPDGVVVIEAFVPDPARYDGEGRRIEIRHLDDTSLHLVVSSHRADAQFIEITHVLADADGLRRHPVTLHYATLRQLDDMAAAAGLELVDRAGGWDRRPYGPDTTDHVSVYRARPTT